jgi:hypothetical protein
VVLRDGPVSHGEATDVADSIDLERLWLVRAFGSPAACQARGW